MIQLKNSHLALSYNHLLSGTISLFFNQEITGLLIFPVLSLYNRNIDIKISVHGAFLK